MGTYLSFFTYERGAWTAMVRRPEDRSEAAGRVIEAAGGRLEAFYWMLGEHDGLAIFTAPEADTAAAVSAAISASGRVARIQTTRLLDAGETRRALEAAHGLTSSYDPPGGASEHWRGDYDEGRGVA
jgi:uncharacterized protein with GYD domain